MCFSTGKTFKNVFPSLSGGQMLQCLMAKVKKIQKKVQIVSLPLVTKLNYTNSYIPMYKCTFTFCRKWSLNLNSQS